MDVASRAAAIGEFGPMELDLNVDFLEGTNSLFVEEESLTKSFVQESKKCSMSLFR